ncbi:MAG TPA: peptidoglycan-binding domain-containing protein [Roseiarcus sp.]|nr:peptidoglycan-binding domain-containing protein [Roseiarcus sp.]
METTLIESLVRIRNSTALLGPSSRGAARLLRERIAAAPKRVVVGAGLAALVAGIGGNALLLQTGRHAPPLIDAAPRDSPPAPAAVEPVAAHAPPALVSAPAAAPAAERPAAGDLRAARAPAPDTTSSVAPVAQDGPRAAAAAASDGARASDPIGALLRGKPVDTESRLVRAAQVALAKLGYAVKIDGAEDSATRRALRRFEHQHGFASTTEISPELVRRLNAAARAGG